jgi:hypothetical protein
MLHAQQNAERSALSIVDSTILIAKGLGFNTTRMANGMLYTPRNGCSKT